MARHRSVEEKLPLFNYDHLPLDIQESSKIVHDAMIQIINEIPSDNSQLTIGLQKLLEAKDCFVRAKMMDLDERLSK